MQSTWHYTTTNKAHEMKKRLCVMTIVFMLLGVLVYRYVELRVAWGGIFPAVVVRTSIQARWVAVTIGNVVLLTGDADDCIIAHEIVHVRQFYRTSGWNLARRMFSDEARINYEAEALVAELNYGKTLENIVDILACDYGRQLKTAEARAYINNYIKGENQ